MTFKYADQCDNGQMIETWYEPTTDEMFDFMVDFIFSQMTKRQREGVSEKTCELILKIIFDDTDLMNEFIESIEDEAKSYFEDKAWGRYTDERTYCNPY